MIEERIALYPSKKLSVGGKTLAYRESGAAGRPLVLLHGIGSGSAWWLFQLEELAARYRVIAWDAPGYGESDAFSIERPHPADYARALSVLVNALQLKNLVLVAHSLGALIATAYARMVPAVPAMVLISPAAGYTENEELSPNAPPLALELVRWNSQRLRPDGYRQASYCLAHANIREDAPHYQGKVLIACGSADRITAEAQCRDIAARFPNSVYRSLPGLGHASPVEDPARVNAMIGEFA